MNIDLTEINQLDTVTKHLTEINQQLEAIKKETMANAAVETIKTIGLIASPFLAGFIFYLLNRNKEYKFKKSEICGGIYSCLFQLRLAKLDYQGIDIEIVGYKHCYLYFAQKDEALPNEEKFRELFKNSSIKMVDHVTEAHKIMSELNKYIGQYRFYLSPEKKKELDDLVKPLSRLMRLPGDYFKDMKLHATLIKMDELVNEIHLDQEFEDDFNRVKKFIDGNEEEFNV